ncbi:hypothetical protein K1719_043178 [Acacia pycnantha]|nr:hypothetical protein K1719_043178 [Acacia pycnantha]
MLQLAHEIIKPPPLDMVPMEIRDNPKHFPYFKVSFSLEFPHPPPGKFYVVDSGYPTRDGYLTPFKGERYHLNDYRVRRNQPFHFGSKLSL